MEGFGRVDTSGLPVFVEFRCILFLDTSESDVLGASRCIRNVWFYAHTSEMSDVWPFRCIVTLVSVGDTSGLRIRFPSRCTWVQILSKYTSGWANTGHFRCIAKNCQNKIHRNSVIHNHPDVSKSSIHRKSRFSSNPDVFHINFPRFYLSSLAAYSRASRPHINFPRIYLFTLAAYSRASKPPSGRFQSTQ